ncbi:MAG: carboxypeptidase-like regulatory domain-containing protein [Chitinophagaceae bacterium]|nr:MAG: carboxypeptidase-like regulatory domain-containing protein [Chitinophagaceae bacterium]
MNEIDAYSCEVYTKAMQKLLNAPKKFFGRDVAAILDLDSNRQGVIYLSETESKLDFKQRNKIKEVMVSSKIAGDDNGFSFNKASDLSVNFYNNILFEDKLSVRGFVSPIADNAFSYYKYKFLGTSEEDGKIISKIQVIPKRKNLATFTGTIYIINDSWRLSAVNLFVTKENGIELIDTMTVQQKLINVGDVYVPQSIQFSITGKLFGFKFSGYVMGVYKNYNVQPTFNKNFFTNEILRVERLSNRKDPFYWEKNRSVPLTIEERNNYRRKDSLSTLKASQKYLDSVDQVKNRFNPGQILVTPYVHYRSYNKKSITFDPVATSVFYNTVEGLALKYAVNWRQGFDDGRYYTIKPEARYGFANDHFNANIKSKYLFDPTRNGSVTLGFGSEVVNLNSNQQTNLLQNTINTLVFGKNVAKFYERRFFNIEASREFAPSFELKLTVDYARRNALTNANFTNFRGNDQFTSNNPFTPTDENNLLFPEHKALVVSGTLAYTVAQRYITRPDGRFYIESNYPRIEFNYKQGIGGVFGSSVDYDFISVEIYQKKLHFGMLGKSSILVGAGKFLTSKSLNYPDWKHFRANQSIVFDPDERNFQFLDFYIFNTTRQYFEAHFQHNFGSFILSKIPLLRKLKLEEIIGSAYLSSPEKRNYNEFYFGVKRLNFRVHYGYAYDRDVLIKKGFKFSYGFNL